MCPPFSDHLPYKFNFIQFEKEFYSLSDSIKAEKSHLPEGASCHKWWRTVYTVTWTYFWHFHRFGEKLWHTECCVADYPFCFRNDYNLNFLSFSSNIFQPKTTPYIVLRIKLSKLLSLFYMKTINAFMFWRMPWSFLN